MVQEGKDRLGDRMKDVVVSWFPALICFVFIPFAIYLPNQREYDYDVTVIFPFLGAAVISFGLLSGLAFLKSPLRTKFAVIIFFFGLFVALSDIFAPAPLTLLEDYSKLDMLDEPLRLTLIQLALGLGLFFCAWKLPAAITRDIAFLIVLGALVSEGVTVAAKLSWRTNFASWGSAALSPPPGESTVSPPKAGNIYQLVFDAYSGCMFQKTVERLGCEKSFEGFTYFRDARSSYIYTPLSYANFMTGTLFDGRSLEDWQDQAVDSGLVERLYQSGYTIWFYPVGLRYVHKRATYVRYPEEKAWVNTNFSRVCLIRMTPNPIRQEINTILRSAASERRKAPDPTPENASLKVSSPPNPTEPDRCCTTMADLLRDEAHRPGHGQYVYFHIMLPHPPLLWDCSCNSTANASYEDNVCCATKLMAQFIQRLKDLGRFENSLIILQSDHGWELDGNDCLSGGSEDIPPEVARTITSSTNDALPAKQFLDRTHPLLLVKPPNRDRLPLQTASAPAQLSDIPATVCELGSVPGGFPTGRNLFDLTPDQSREFHFFAGYKRAGKNEGVLVLGKHILSGRLGHFSFSKGQGWKVYPALPVRYGTGWFSH